MRVAQLSALIIPFSLAGVAACAGSGGPKPEASGGSSASSGGAPQTTDEAETSDMAGDSEGAETTEQSAGGAGQVGDGTERTPIDCRRDGDGTTTLVFVNGCGERVAYAGSDIEGGTVEPGGFVCVDVGTDSDPISSKRYWGFVGQDPGAEHHTLAEFTFNTDFYDFDWYNISHVDAHNLPMQIVPVARADCEVLTCEQDFVEMCPAEGQFKNDAGQVIACVSPDRDDPKSPVAQFFEHCDDAYAWSGDDQQGDDPSPMRACAGEDWDVVFCPEAEP